MKPCNKGDICQTPLRIGTTTKRNFPWSNYRRQIWYGESHVGIPWLLLKWTCYSLHKKDYKRLSNGLPQILDNQWKVLLSYCIEHENDSKVLFLVFMKHGPHIPSKELGLLQHNRQSIQKHCKWAFEES